MNVISIILLIAIIGLTLWLTIDTAIGLVKKIKQKKKDKKETTTKE